MRLYFGGREIVLRYLGKAHTSGDIFILLPEENLAFVGDVAQDGGVPYLGDSYPAEWPDTDDRLVELPIDRFMSGHGPIGDHQALLQAREFIHDLVDHLKTSIRDGQDETAGVASAVDALRPRFGGWRGFEGLGDGAAELYRKLLP
jgi:glyoxylase-like metal-dependent hydrolase (beta-lactamase superfamily II)